MKTPEEERSPGQMWKDPETEGCLSSVSEKQWLEEGRTKWKMKNDQRLGVCEKTIAQAHESI